MSTFERMTGGARLPDRVGSGVCDLDGLPGHARGNVRVVVRRGNYSAFNGYRFTPSEYSELQCACGRARWRSRAAYVAAIPGG